MTALQVPVHDLSELELAALGIVHVFPETDDPEVAGFHLVAPDGTTLGPGSVVTPPRVVVDEHIVQLGPLTPVLPTRWHRTAKFWKPKWLTIKADSDGEIDLVTLGGPALWVDRVTQYADGTWESWSWWCGYGHAMSKDAYVWPDTAPEFAVATVRWLIDSRPYLHLPEKG